MARKRKSLAHLDYNSPKYWNYLLAEEGLSMDRALQPNKLIYVGGSVDVESVEGKIRMESGRIDPKPQAE